MSKINPVELWKAIHGGCWPGPPPDVDNRINVLTNEVIANLALYNFSNSFADTKVSNQIRGIAVEGLNKSLPSLQKVLEK